MRRRTFLHLIGGGLPALTSLGTVFGAGIMSDSAGTSDTHQRPNIVLITLDDQNDRLGVLGQQGAKSITPNLDRLAERGMFFPNAQCPAPLCNPSRTSLMTGLFPSTTGLVGNKQAWRDNVYLENAMTLPEYLMEESGYNAFRVGKIFHQGENDPACWQRDGFDGNGPTFGFAPWPDTQGLTYPAHNWPHGFFFDWGPFTSEVDWKYNKNGETNPFRYENDMNRTALPDEQSARWAGEIIRKKHADPYFLAVGFYRPHLPRSCMITEPIRTNGTIWPKIRTLARLSGS